MKPNKLWHFPSHVRVDQKQRAQQGEHSAPHQGPQVHCAAQVTSCALDPAHICQQNVPVSLKEKITP